MNPYERAGRMSKVAKVVGFLARQPETVDADTLVALPERGWVLLALAAGVKPLSAESRQAVVAAFELPAETGDPFASFAGMGS